jgi:hypothetical protein
MCQNSVHTDQDAYQLWGTVRVALLARIQIDLTPYCTEAWIFIILTHCFDRHLNH